MKILLVVNANCQQKENSATIIVSRFWSIVLDSEEFFTFCVNDLMQKFSLSEPRSAEICAGWQEEGGKVSSDWSPSRDLRGRAPAHTPLGEAAP